MTDRNQSIDDGPNCIESSFKGKTVVEDLVNSFTVDDYYFT